MKRLLHLSLIALLLASCAGTGKDVTEAGNGFPEPTVEFPANSSPGSTQSAVLTVENPGPGDMTSVFVTFMVASPAAAGEEFPTPIANGGPKGDDPNVLSVSPEPEAVDSTGITYRFPALPEGEELTVTFELRIPEEPGPAANAIIVSDGSERERARGVRLQTEVEG